jgi:hypothetical protein
LKRGAVLVDDNDRGQEVKALVYLEHSIQDARTERSGKRRVVSRRMQFVEVDGLGVTRSAGPAPYLDYRPLTAEEQQALRQLPEPAWLRSDLEAKVLEHAIARLVPGHFDEVKRPKEELIDRTLAAVKDRLTKEINHWDHRAAQLKDQELAGKVNARLNSGLARQRADGLTSRLQKRLAELEQERKLAPLPPVVLGGAMIAPAGLLRRLQGKGTATPPTFAADTARSEKLAMEAVLRAERALGYVPRDVSAEKLGYDVESAVPKDGRLRFIEVKGRVAGATTVTVTKNEILTGWNKPDDFILAIVEVEGDAARTPRYVGRPFQREPDFGVTSVNYDLNELLARAEDPA